MALDSSFPVEDFLEAITAQLDRTQDALRMKAVNRPLTYAIRDFSMELKVFVELDSKGQVRFRPSASNDTGASVVTIGFTTVNRTMIDENTVSLTASKSPSLDELGLDEQERRQLERLGVRNADQLEQLGRATSETTVARFSGLPVNRLRQAMAQGKPAISSVSPILPAAALPGSAAAPVPMLDPRPRDAVDVASNGSNGVDTSPDPLRLPTRTRKIRVDGRRLDETARAASLNNRELSWQPVDGGLEIDLGDDPADGMLQLDLGDHGHMALSLEFEQPPRIEHDDPWRPA